jgi:hypothetical protein
MSSSDQAFSLSNRVQNTDHRVLGPAHYLQKRFCSPDLLFRRYFCPFPHPPHHRYQARTPYFPYIRLKSLQVPTPRHDDRLPHDTRGSRRCGMQGLQASAPDEGEEDAAGRDGVAIETEVTWLESRWTTMVGLALRDKDRSVRLAAG